MRCLDSSAKPVAGCLSYVDHFFLSCSICLKWYVTFINVLKLHFNVGMPSIFLHCYCVGFGSWRSLTPMNHARAMHGAACVHERCFVAGGLDRSYRFSCPHTSSSMLSMNIAAWCTSFSANMHPLFFLEMYPLSFAFKYICSEYFLFSSECVE